MGSEKWLYCFSLSCLIAEAKNGTILLAYSSALDLLPLRLYNYQYK
jgi:hypothetical protein